MNSPPELAVYTEVFQKCDTSRTGEISPAVIKELFLTATGLDRQHLRLIWEIVNPQNKPGLARGEFFAALRLISIVQAGKEATVQNLQMYAIGQVTLPMPAFTGSYAPSAPAPTAAAAPSDVWTLRPQERRNYLGIFDQHQTNGVISGKAAAPLFYQILGLEKKSALRGIWTLADHDHDGVLNAEEFVAAMCLINRHKDENVSIPSALPSTLVPGNQREDAPAAAAMSGGDAFASLSGGGGGGADEWGSSAGASLMSMSAQPSSVVEPSPAIDSWSGGGGGGMVGGMVGGGSTADAMGGSSNGGFGDFDAQPALPALANATDMNDGFGGFDASPAASPIDDAFGSMGVGGNGGDSWGSPPMSMSAAPSAASLAPTAMVSRAAPQQQQMVPTGGGGGNSQASALEANALVVSDLSTAVNHVRGFGDSQRAAADRAEQQLEGLVRERLRLRSELDALTRTARENEQRAAQAQASVSQLQNELVNLREELKQGYRNAGIMEGKRAFLEEQQGALQQQVNEERTSVASMQQQQQQMGSNVSSPRGVVQQAVRRMSDNVESLGNKLRSMGRQHAPAPTAPAAAAAAAAAAAMGFGGLDDDSFGFGAEPAAAAAALQQQVSAPSAASAFDGMDFGVEAFGTPASVAAASGAAAFGGFDGDFGGMGADAAPTPSAPAAASSTFDEGFEDSFGFDASAPPPMTEQVAAPAPAAADDFGDGFDFGGDTPVATPAGEGGEFDDSFAGFGGDDNFAATQPAVDNAFTSSENTFATEGTAPENANIADEWAADASATPSAGGFEFGDDSFGATENAFGQGGGEEPAPVQEEEASSSSKKKKKKKKDKKEKKKKKKKKDRESQQQQQEEEEEGGEDAPQPPRPARASVTRPKEGGEGWNADWNDDYQNAADALPDEAVAPKPADAAGFDSSAWSADW